MGLKRDARIQCRFGVLIKDRRDTRRFLIIVFLVQSYCVTLCNSYNSVGWSLVSLDGVDCVVNDVVAAVFGVRKECSCCLFAVC